MGKYEEALERARQGKPIDEVFPELKESEIRKSVIGFLKTIASLKDGKTVSNKDFDSKALLEWASYLEKQKEQKPVSISCGHENDKPAEWSEEDEDKADDICKLIEHATIIPRSGDDDTGIPPTRLNDKYKDELKAFVKSFRPHPKQEWSKEDKYKVIQYLHEKDGGMLWTKATEITNDICDILRPQPHWKPSEEQMIELRAAISGCSYDIEPLVEIEEQLKKLM